MSLTLNKSNPDTLQIGVAQGLYCLINLGDLNADGKEEIALVVDHLDFSGVNQCEIYSYCSNQWTLLKRFSIHEEAFIYMTENALRFDAIKGYLEKRDGRWMYLDYEKALVSDEADSKMMPLKVDLCK